MLCFAGVPCMQSADIIRLAAFTVFAFESRFLLICLLVSNQSLNSSYCFH